MRDRPESAPVLSPFWRTALVLWVLALLGIAAVLPYVTTLEHDVLLKAVEKAHLALWQLLAISLLQSAVLFAIVIAAGLWAARKVGLGLPLISAALTRTPVPKGTLKTFGLSLGIGIVTAFALGALDKWVFAPIPSVAALMAAAAHGQAAAPPAWQGLLASFYGAFDEELLMRLGLVSLFTLALRRPFGVSAAFWVANVVAAVIFGLGHLPATAALAPLSTALVVRAIVLNGVVGVIAGGLYKRYGLEYGMASHLGFDLVAHVLFA
jgi:hypothetical protein